jgi:hypothetical protein
MSEVIGRRSSNPKYEDTPNEIFEIEKTYKEAEEDLVKFVEKQIELMKANLLFGGSDIPSFYALNKSLMDFESVTLGLLSLHQECRLQFQLHQEKYDNFYADKFVEIKQEQVSLGKQAQFTAARDIELCVRKRYMKELAKMKAEVIKAENKYNFINHLISGWEKYSFILGQLSKNAIAEAAASGVASRNPKEFSDDGE